MGSVYLSSALVPVCSSGILVYDIDNAAQFTEFLQEFLLLLLLK